MDLKISQKGGLQKKSFLKGHAFHNDNLQQRVSFRKAFENDLLGKSLKTFIALFPSTIN